MELTTRPTVSRRELLRKTGLATGGLVLASVGFAGTTTANGSADPCDADCLRVCWVDVKPSSCPNSVNPSSGGVLPVSAGWPRFEAGSVKLYPVKGEYDPAFCDCQDFEDQQYRAGVATAEELCTLVQSSNGRYAEPTWSTVEDVDGDGDDDTKFKFDVAALELEPDDRWLVLVGKSADDGCTYVGIDSVRVLDNGSTNGNRSSPRAKGRKSK
ncbi:hypothetical protein [Haloarchaeobius sp. DFWS5]|uniref:hypothetical protein n=1 Tax=Haloarchaeobius sp. DFWS5 TaxID=3446114 RepID=UPI003EBC4EA3